MKYKYALFAYSGYSEEGGMNDLKLLFNTKEELLNKVRDIEYDYYQLVNLEDMMITTWESNERGHEKTLNDFIQWVHESFKDEGEGKYVQ